MPVLSEATVRREPSDRDMRRKRSPAISFLLRVETARRAVRVLTLLALDFAGLSAAIFTSLVLKAAVLSEVSVHGAYEETRSILAFAYLLTALLFARSGLYAAGAQRPGMTRIVACALPGDVRGGAVRAGQRRALLELLHLLGLAGVRAAVRTAAAATCTSGPRARSLRDRGPRAPRGAGGHGLAHPRGGARARGRAPLARGGRGVRLAARAARERSALAGHPARPGAGAERPERVDEVIIADPDFPQAEAVELVDRCHQRGVRVRIAPSTMEILIHRAEFVPGESVPLFELKPPVFEGIDFALKRTFDVVGATVLLVAAEPAAGGDLGGGARDLAAARRCSARCARGSASGRSRA